MSLRLLILIVLVPISLSLHPPVAVSNDQAFGQQRGVLDPGAKEGTSSEQQVVVAGVKTGGPAERAGFAKGDLILRLDGRPFTLEELAVHLLTWVQVRPTEFTLRRDSDTVTVRLPAVSPGDDPGIDLLPPGAAGAGKTATGSHEAAAWVSWKYGERLAEEKSWEDADRAFEEAATLAGQDGHRRLEAAVLLTQARTLQERGDHSLALDTLERALGLVQNGGEDGLFEALVLHRLGSEALSVEDFDLAARNMEKALTIRERLAPGSLVIAASLQDLAEIAKKTGRVAEAQKLLRRGLVILKRQAPGSRLMAKSLAQLGSVLRLTGELPAAREHCLRATAILERVAPQSLDLAHSLAALGTVAWQQWELAEAEALYLRSLEIRQHLAPDGLEVARSMIGLGLIALRRRELSAARDYFQKSMVMLERSAPDSLVLSSCLQNLAIVSFRLGNLNQAREYLQQALSIRERKTPDSINMAGCLNNLAIIAWRQGDLAEAEACIRRALEFQEALAPESIRMMKVLDSLGEVALARGDPMEARTHLLRALTIYERLNPVGHQADYLFHGLGKIALAEGNVDEAEERFRHALEIRLEVTPGTTPEATSRHGLARALAAQERYGEALQELRIAVTALESQRGRIDTGPSRKFFLEQWVDIYHDLIRSLLDESGDAPMAGRWAEAYRVAEAVRSRTFLETLAEVHAGITGGIAPERKAEEQRLLVRISAAWEVLRVAREPTGQKAALAKLRLAEQDFDSFRESLRRNDPRYAGLQYPIPVGLEEVRSVLRPDELLLEYVLAAGRSWCFVIGPGRFEVHPLPGRDSIVEQVRAVRDLLATPDPFRPARVLAGLHDTLLEGIDLPEGARLLVSPDDVLHYLPFEALVLPDGRYLVERNEVTYVPSGTVLRELRTRPERSVAPLSLLALGDPAAARPGKGAGASSAVPLPFARKELRDIGRLFDSPRLLNGKEAMETVIKGEDLKRYRLLHFAAHARADDVAPARSGIILASDPGSGEDGYLSMREILNLETAADLVVLSACDTGRGRLTRGEGIIGLTRAWFYTGTPSVVSTLWTVNDSSTSMLMTRLYAALSAGRPKSAVLREAKLYLLSAPGAYAFRHPYYWAPFLLHGESD